MPTPVLIDTDMGVDDAVALALAIAAGELQVVGLASVGGNVPLDQATGNMARVLAGLKVTSWPPTARGLDHDRPELLRATNVFGADGLGETGLPMPADYAPGDFTSLYEQCIAAHGAALTIIAIGPLTNLAALLRSRPGLLHKAGRIVIMGGAVWCPGNVTPHAEFNFYRDPQAAAEVLAAGLPVTLVPLDITRQVAMDESHVAHLSRSSRGPGELLARMIRYLLDHATEALPGKFLVHDAVAVGALLWPELFMRSRMGLEVVTSGAQAGRTRPVVAKDKSRQLSVVISVNVTDLLEKLLECLCHEEFIV